MAGKPAVVRRPARPVVVRPARPVVVRPARPVVVRPVAAAPVAAAPVARAPVARAPVARAPVAAAPVAAAPVARAPVARAPVAAAPVAAAPVAAAPVAPAPAPAPIPAPPAPPAPPVLAQPKIGTGWLLLIVVLLVAALCAAIFHGRKTDSPKPVDHTALREQRVTDMWRQVAELNKSEAPKTVTAQEAFRSNMESWNHKELENPAQLRLAPEYEVVVKQLIESNFTSYDERVVERASRKIWDIAGDRATAIIVEYTNDPRVVVSENARAWYHQYCPKGILDRIDGTQRQRVAPPTSSATPPDRPGAQATVNAAAAAKRADELKADVESLKGQIKSAEADRENCLKLARKEWQPLREQAEKDRRHDEEVIVALTAKVNAKLAEMNNLLSRAAPKDSPPVSNTAATSNAGGATVNINGVPYGAADPWKATAGLRARIRQVQKDLEEAKGEERSLDETELRALKLLLQKTLQSMGEKPCR